jgi:hypothetical protein
MIPGKKLYRGKGRGAMPTRGDLAHRRAVSCLSLDHRESRVLSESLDSQSLDSRPGRYQKREGHVRGSRRVTDACVSPSRPNADSAPMRIAIGSSGHWGKEQ